MLSPDSSAPARAPLRVVVDGRELTGMGRYSGLGTFTRNLVHTLSTDPRLRLRVLTTDTSAVPAGVEAVRMWRRFHERRRSIYEHEALIAFDVARTRGDVVYSPVLSGVPYTRRPYAQTLYDVIPLVLPDAHLAYLRKWWRRWARAYRRADAVVALSRYTADEGVRLLGLDPARVSVAPLGVNPRFRFDPTAPVPDGPPYLLTVSEYSPRKRFGDAFAVVSALADEGFPHHLRAAGRIQHQYEQEVTDLVGTSGRPDRIEVLGFVDDLPALYRGASVFLWCSSYEGFGLPVAEAMAAGVPVVAYANSSIPEVVGDAGILVPDGDVKAMIAAARRLVDEPALRADMSAAGIERARELTWDACASAYADVFCDLAGR